MSSLTINTPAAITQCQDTLIMWQGGIEPYYVGYIVAGSIGTASSPSPAVSFQTDQNSQEWLCNVAAGVQITLTVQDSSGQKSYSSPVTIQDSGDVTCLPGYTSPEGSSSRLSRGAIGGIVAGVVGALLILGLVLALLWRERRRKKAARIAGLQSEKEGYREQGEPKVEPYVRTGEVDLGEEASDQSTTRTLSGTGGSGDEPAGQLEREVKQMLGVGPNTISPTSASRSPVSPIPIKSVNQSHPTSSSPTTNTSEPPALAAPITTAPAGHGPPDCPNAGNRSEASTPLSGEQEVEYVRHTDGGVMQVELPPLYSDVPRRE